MAKSKNSKRRRWLARQNEGHVQRTLDARRANVERALRPKPKHIEPDMHLSDYFGKLGNATDIGGIRHET